MEGQVIELSGKSLYTQVRVLPANDLQDKNGDAYWRLVYGNTVFTTSDADLVEGLRDGKIASLSIVPTEREVEDEQTGQKVKVPSYAYGGHMTYAAMKNIARNEGELKAIEMQAAKLLEVPQGVEAVL